MSNRVRTALVAAMAVAAACGPSLRVRTAANPVAIEELWENRRNIASLDLFHGVGGKALAPDPKGPFTFVAEDTQGASPGYTVRDDSGLEWDVKLDRKSTRLNSSHSQISYAVFCLKKKK